ncbi:MAG: DUF3817 domain-containing protein [Micrococcales bacterium]|nr:DUF3817 domain-containing protein [Micrococcales bacterium]
MSPIALFRRVALAEVITWALLIVGMVLKYVTHTTDLGVRVFGLVHGVVFLAFVLATLALWVDRRWSAGQALLGLASSVPPFMTLPFERWAEARGLLADRWRLASEAPATLAERIVAWALRSPVLAALAAGLAIGLTTAFLLWVGPPVPWAR